MSLTKATNVTRLTFSQQMCAYTVNLTQICFPPNLSTLTPPSSNLCQTLFKIPSPAGNHQLPGSSSKYTHRAAGFLLFSHGLSILMGRPSDI